MSYTILNLTATITQVKLTIGFLLIFIASIEWYSIRKQIQFDRKYLLYAGMLSGFFGGLSGQQGAFRSPMLVNIGLSKEQFIGTSATIATMVDVTRLLVYSVHCINLQALGLTMR